MNAEIHVAECRAHLSDGQTFFPTLCTHPLTTIPLILLGRLFEVDLIRHTMLSTQTHNFALPQNDLDLNYNN